MGSFLTRRDLDWELRRLDVFAEYCEHHQRAGAFGCLRPPCKDIRSPVFQDGGAVDLLEGADQTGVDQTAASRPVQDSRSFVAGEKSFVPGSKSFIPGSELFIPGSRSFRP
jgi:hypothetical protein